MKDEDKTLPTTILRADRADSSRPHRFLSAYQEHRAARGSTLWELGNHRVIHPGDVFIAPPGRISSADPRARLIIARMRVRIVLHRHFPANSKPFNTIKRGDYF